MLKFNHSLLFSNLKLINNKEDQMFVITYISKAFKPYTFIKRFTRGEDKLAKAATKTVSEGIGSHTPKVASGANISKTKTGDLQSSTLAQKTNPKPFNNENVTQSPAVGQLDTNNPTTLAEQVENVGVTPGNYTTGLGKTVREFVWGSDENYITTDNVEVFTETNNNLAIDYEDDVVETVPHVEKSVYKGGTISAKFVVISSEGDSSNPQSEPHALIVKEDDQGKKIMGVFTSSKGGTPDGKTNNIRISNTKFNGDSTPRLKKGQSAGMDDENNKLPITQYPSVPVNDDFGDFVPDPRKGGQYVRIFQNQRMLLEEDIINLGYEEDPQITEYINRPEILIQIQEIDHMTKENQTSIMISNNLSDLIIQESLNDEDDSNN